MKDSVFQFCLAVMNFMSVVLLCCVSGPPPTTAHKFLRGTFVFAYFVTLIFISKGEENENNRGEDDDV